MADCSDLRDQLFPTRGSGQGTSCGSTRASAVYEISMPGKTQLMPFPNYAQAFFMFRKGGKI